MNTEDFRDYKNALNFFQCVNALDNATQYTIHQVVAAVSKVDISDVYLISRLAAVEEKSQAVIIKESEVQYRQKLLEAAEKEMCLREEVLDLKAKNLELREEIQRLREGDFAKNHNS